MRNLLLLSLTFILLFTQSQCHSPSNPLDAVKDYQPDDKYFKSVLVSLHYMIETDRIEDVDAVFSQIISNNNLPVSAKGTADGEYTGESPVDAFDYKHIVHLQIQDEKIIAVDYNEIHLSGIGKEEDVDYNEEMSVTGTTPAQAYPLMEQQLLEQQNSLKVDAVSGATYSLHRFRYALAVALMKARLAAGNNGLSQ